MDKTKGGVDDLPDDADALVNRTAHFVEEWIEEHVVEQPMAVAAGVDIAAEMAKQCVADARKEGIEAEDIQEEVGDLKEYIADTLSEENVPEAALRREPPHTSNGRKP